MKTLREMTAEVRECNTEKGWRVVRNPWGDYVALIHSEISEILEAYRDHRLADATEPHHTEGLAADPRPPKPEGVGSECADVLIRILDHLDVVGWPLNRDAYLTDVHANVLEFEPASFGGWVSWLHMSAAQMYGDPVAEPGAYEHSAGWVLLRRLLGFCNRWGIDLDREYERKIAYNWTREFQHGGRTMADSETPEVTT